MQSAGVLDQARFGALFQQRGPRPIPELFRQRIQFRHQPGVQGLFHCLLAHRGLIGEAHAIGGQNAGVRMNEHRFHAESVGHQARMLPTGATKTLQCEACHIVTLLH
jgi:hypothetical protein